MNIGKYVSLERALLVLSGLEEETEIQSYQQKIEDIWDRFLQKHARRGFFDHPKPPLYLHRSIAKSLFDYLWISKPKRFGEDFLLSHVLNAQLNPDAHLTVGNCVGLTCLYSVLGLRTGLNLSLLVNLDHLLNRLRVGNEAIDIDHTDPEGFDCGNREGFSELPLRAITAIVLNSRGLDSENVGNYEAAKAYYRKAVEVNPEYASALNNRGNMRYLEEDFEGAIWDYTKAIRISQHFCEAYCNRGMAKQRLGLHDEARQDYNMAISINSHYSDAHRCLHLLDNMVIPARFKTG